MKLIYAAALGLVACTADRIVNQSTAPALTDVAPVLIGAGDISECDPRNAARLTAHVIDSVLALDPSNHAFTAGDNAYEYGRTADWACYDKTWGKFKARTWFGMGNHEVHEDTSGTDTYDYILGPGVNSGENGTRGNLYHAHDLGGWRLYFLNSERNVSAQTAWLKADLAANPRLCQLMVFHRPLYMSANMVPAKKLRNWYLAFWQKRGDIVINGHVHSYERTGLIRPDTRAGALASDAVLDATGFRVFVEGGGGSLHFTGFPPVVKPYSEKRVTRTHGVLKLTLNASSYTWERLDTLGRVNDHGTQACH
jgi:acid phosphatase type 7